MKVQYQSISPTWHTVLITAGLCDFFPHLANAGRPRPVLTYCTICRTSIRSSYCSPYVVVFMQLTLRSMKFPVLVAIVKQLIGNAKT